MSTPAISAAVSERSLPATSRLVSIDILRGLVMVIMALDHTRDFFSNALFDATDLTRTTPLLFLTRWITHFCAPVFVLLAGTGAFLSMKSGKSRAEVSRFLFTRGIWLVFLEVAVISPLGWSWSLEFGFTRLQVIWVIGVSMIILAILIQVLPSRAIAAFGLAMILGHNLTDGPHAAWLGPLAPTWKVLHSLSFFQPWPHKIVASLYPLIPWVGVMALGYGGGEVALLPECRRRRMLLWTGIAMVGTFVLLRVSNFYGDPQPWAAQRSGIFTLLSFLNCNKYPPSLLYLLMTLGPAMFVLAFADKLPTAVKEPLNVFGRVPLFYYLLHLPILHGLAVVFSLVSYGLAGWMFQDLMALRGTKHPLPQGYGYDLWVVYLVWAAVVVMLYPLCKWFGKVKRSNKSPVLAYF
jgi:uncharacterized membrane protein